MQAEARRGAGTEWALEAEQRRRQGAVAGASDTRVVSSQASVSVDHIAYRFALDPTVRQRRELAQHCGAARFAFNWGLEQVHAAQALRAFERCMFGDVRDEGLGWSLAALRREWNREKHRVAPWWQQHSKEAYSSGLSALSVALRNWRRSQDGSRVGPAVGFPQFRKRGGRDACRFTTGAIRVDDARHVTLPRIGRIRTAEGTERLVRRIAARKARIVAATVCREADRWFVSFTCEVGKVASVPNRHADTVGVDVGVLVLAALSTGEMVAGPRALARSLRALRRAQRRAGRRRRGSRRRQLAKKRVSMIHRRVANVRRHHLHVLTTRLAKSHGRIVVEDLNVRGMTRAARGTVAQPGRNVRAKAGQNRVILDAGFWTMRRMLAYKCRWYGSTLVVADRWFPSSKRCSSCGTVRVELRRREPIFHCDACGVALHRDVNAACNLVWWADAHCVAASAAETENARGGSAVIRLRAGERSHETRTGNGPEPAGVTIGGRLTEHARVR